MNKKSVLIMTVIIVMQMIALTVSAFQKQGYHIDEVYSYILSNSYDADKIVNNDKAWEKWISGEELERFVTVNEGEKFAYDKVYYNNSTDCHPPLFYWCLHTVCSFFPGVFTKWTGLLMNFFFMIIADIIMYFISKELIDSDKLKFLPAVLYSLSVCAVDTAIFIRMYALLTLFLLLYVWQYINVIKNGSSKKRLAFILITLYLGAMTQYYFIVFAFCGTMIFCIYSLHKKRIKEMLLYGLGSCVSVGAMILSFPYVIEQATGSSTNNIGNEVMRTLFDVKLWIIQIKNLLFECLNKISCYNIISKIIVCVVFAVLLYLIIKMKKDHELPKARFETMWLILTSAGTFVLIAYIGGDYVYLRYVYYIIPLFYILFVTIFEKLSVQYPKFQSAVLIVSVIFAVSNVSAYVIGRKSEYLGLDWQKILSKVTEYRDTGLIVMSPNERRTAIPTGNFTCITQFSSVYMDTDENIINDNVLGEYLDDNESCVVYIPTDKYWLNTDKSADEVLYEITNKLGYEVNYSKIERGLLGEYYIINRI